MLPVFNSEGELPAGVHPVTWQEFRDRFCGFSLKRAWLAGRLKALLQLAESTGRLRRVFVWGSFVTAKVSPGDLDVLLIMDEGFGVESLPETSRGIRFSAGESAVPGGRLLGARVDMRRDGRPLAGNVPDFPEFQETRYCGTGDGVIETDDRMIVAQRCIDNLRRILLAARKTHSGRDYAQMAEPILLELRQREQEILEYPISEVPQPVAN